MTPARSLAFVCVLASGSLALAQAPASTPGFAPQAVTPATAPAAVAPAPGAAAAVAAGEPNTLLDGTAIKLRLAETISSATAKVGQSVNFEVVDEVAVQGLPVIAKGAQAIATVTVAETKKSMGRGGKLDVNIDSVRLADGEKATLRATSGGKGGGHTGAMTAGMVGTAIVFFPAAPFLLFIHGKDITIPKGTEVTAFVSGDVKLEMAKFAPVGLPGATGAAAAAPVMASLSIDASQPNAEITVDGAFAGNTPSTLSMTPGQHTIVVSKKGFSEWARVMNVSGTGAKVSADLEAKP